MAREFEYSHHVTSLDAMQTLKQLLDLCPNLRSLSLVHLNLRKDLVHLLELGSKKSLQTLKVRGGKGGDELIKNLGLGENKNLNKLCVADMAVTQDGIRSLQMDRNTSLETLYIHDLSPEMDPGGLASSGLDQNSTLKHLILLDTPFGASSLDALRLCESSLEALIINFPHLG